MHGAFQENCIELSFMSLWISRCFVCVCVWVGGSVVFARGNPFLDSCVFIREA